MRKNLSRLGAICLIATFGFACAMPVIGSARPASHAVAHHKRHHKRGHRQLRRLRNELNRLNNKLSMLESQSQFSRHRVRVLKQEINQLQRTLRAARRYYSHCSTTKHECHYYIPPPFRR